MIRIDPATEADWSEVTDLLHAADLPYEDLSVDSAPDFRVLRENGRVLGTVGLEPAGPVALLRSLVVHPDVRRHGYGAALVESIENHARSADYSSLYLLTTSAADFFEKRGYRRIDRASVPPPVSDTEEFRRLCPDTAACMQKSLIS